MAKGFYTLEEAAQRLGRSIEEVKSLAARGQLRQFRDRDSLMFKVDEVNALAATDESAAPLSDTGAINLESDGDSGIISLADTANQETGAIELADTGIQDTGEIELTDTNLGDTSLGNSTGLDLGGTGEINIADDSGEITLSGSDSGISLDDTAGGDDTVAGSSGNFDLGESAAGSTGGLELADTGAGSTGIDLDGIGEADDGDATGLGLGDTGAISLGESAAGSTGLGLADSADLSDDSAINLEDDPNQGSSGLGLALDDIGGTGDGDGVSLDTGTTDSAPKEDARQATGISVFDADEVEEADPMDQTVVQDAMTTDEDLALESVGSGSGLLDLTRESDDTSLGAELLDEIYPNQDTQAAGDTRMDTAAGSSGVFDGAVTLDAPAAEDSAELETAAATADATAADDSAVLEPTMDMTSPAAVAPQADAMSGAMVYSEAEPFDPVGSGWSTGLLLGSFAALIVAVIIAVSAIADIPSVLLKTMAADTNTLYMYLGIIGGVTFVFAIIGFFLGRMYSK